MSEKRFFKADDGARYWVVANDMDEAKRILAETGIEWDGDPEWSEMTEGAAAVLRCDTREDDRGRGKIPLSQCDHGEWFCSEW